jgi:mannosyltransferase
VPPSQATSGHAPSGDAQAPLGIAPPAALGDAPSALSAARAAAPGSAAPGSAGQGAAPGGGRSRLARRARSSLVVVVPAAAELAVGGYRLGGASLWRDEAYTLDAATRSFGQIVGLLGNQDAVHGVYYLGMHIVIGLLGTSATAIRLPSLLAMTVAAGATAAIGRRLARATDLPAPGATGLLAGLLFVGSPETTFYAQDARPYALVTMSATMATLVLLAAVADGRRRWWAGYGAAIAVAGMFNLFALLLLAAHGVTLLAGRVPLRRWLAAGAAAIFVLSPLIYLGYRQDRALGWVPRPSLSEVVKTATDFAGSGPLLQVVTVLAICGILAGLDYRRRHGTASGLTVTVVALPWLVLPPVILLLASLVRPVYVERYVLFCLPGLALLCAGGLAWLAQLVTRTGVGSRNPAVAWMLPAVIVATLAALLVVPQQRIRLTAARPDNLRGVAAVIAANARRGDVVFYVPEQVKVVSMGYPAPFARLREIAQRQTPVASDSLLGSQVSASQLRSRFAGVRRVWLITWHGRPRPRTATSREELALVGQMRLVRLWTVGSVVLRLYMAR